VDLPYSTELKKELEAHDYDHTGKMQIRIESKKYVKMKLGGDSPDLADSAVFTMAAEQMRSQKLHPLPVVKRPRRIARRY
jgi:hypothetical protein